MAPKSILKKTTTKKPTPGGRTASGKRVRPGQNIRKAQAAEKEHEAKASKGKGKGRFDKPKPSGKYEKYTGPEEYKGPTGGNAGPLGKAGAASAKKGDVKGKGKGDVGGGKKKVTIAVRKEKEDKDEEEDDDVDMSGEDGFGDEEGSGSEGEGTDEELGRPKGSKSSGNKRKRVTTATKFGDTLTSLLAEPSSSTSIASASASATKKAKTQQPILSLSKAKLPPSRSALALERKAEEAVKKAKTDRVEKARVVDVMEGWQQPGGSQEFERGLRKVAQRGVIKLFNAILSASRATEEEGLQMPEPERMQDEKTKKRQKDNILGRGGKEVLTKEGFLDMVRQG